MGIHYDYKSTRGDKAMKKEAKRKAELNKEEQKSFNNPKAKKIKSCMILTNLYA